MNKIARHIEIADIGGGSNQVRVRAYNERLVLSLVRRHQALSKAEIARRSGLSPQTVSVIMRELESDNLLKRGEPIRGKVGQPSTPMQLNAEGVFSVGLKIGRRSANLVLLDFVGAVRETLYITYPFPRLPDIITFVKEGVAKLRSAVAPQLQARICGLGVAAPHEIWNWVHAVGAPDQVLEEWRDADIAAMLVDAAKLPVFLQNDATAACAAELVFGHGPHFSDFAYFFVGIFVGGGIAINHELYPGRNGNAGAFGSIPIPDKAGHTHQLIDGASIYLLERMVKDAGGDARSIWKPPEEWDDFGVILDEWIALCAHNLAIAILTISATMGFEAIVIDGWFSPDVRRRLVEATREEFAKLDHQGIEIPVIEEGVVGSDARAIGAASLPLFERYLTSQTVLFKEMADVDAG